MDELKVDQLPYLCLKLIFGYLSFKDLVRCRAVSRLFKEYAEETRVTELIVSDHQLPCGKQWRLCSHWDDETDASVNSEHEISWSALLFAHRWPFKLIQNLKSLHVHLRDTVFKAEVLKPFEQQLVHLELYEGSRLRRRGQRTTLTLPNLKVLRLRLCNSGFGHLNQFVLNTPSLEVLGCDSSDRIEFDYPETIKELDLTIWKQLDSDRVRTLLSTLKNLKELAVETGTDMQFILNYPEDEDEAEQIRILLFNLAYKRDGMGREDPKIYLHNVLVDSADQLASRESMRYPDSFCLKNYKRMRRPNFEVYQVNFQNLTAMGVELSDEFFTKFPKINSVNSSGPVDRDAFGRFLKKLSALRKLELENTTLDQTWFDHLLPTICSQLIDLAIRGSSNLVTNFDFILHFRQLRSFYIGQRLSSLESPAKAFRRLNHLWYFGFRASDRSVFIFRRLKIKNNYTVSFRLDSDVGDIPVSPACNRHANLKWAELVALFDQNCPLN